MEGKGKPVGHLVGAYGLFWDAAVVDWFRGSGFHAWQLLGRKNKRHPALRVCDFRQAHGVYVLHNDYGPGYAGLARGSGGLGGRLRSHVKKPPRGFTWTRFSWFSFDDVKDHPGKKTGWLKKMLPIGTRVKLRSDPSQDLVDRYDRLLRYVIRSKDSSDMNRAQIWRGNAQVYDNHPFRRVDSYRKAQRQAKAALRGFWKNC